MLHFGPPCAVILLKFTHVPCLTSGRGAPRSGKQLQRWHSLLWWLAMLLRWTFADAGTGTGTTCGDVDADGHLTYNGTGTALPDVRAAVADASHRPRERLHSWHKLKETHHDCTHRVRMNDDES